jgi:hypothetical protein
MDWVMHQNALDWKGLEIAQWVADIDLQFREIHLKEEIAAWKSAAQFSIIEAHLPVKIRTWELELKQLNKKY